MTGYYIFGTPKDTEEFQRYFEEEIITTGLPSYESLSELANQPETEGIIVFDPDSLDMETEQLCGEMMGVIQNKHLTVVPIIRISQKYLRKILSESEGKFRVMGLTEKLFTEFQIDRNIHIEGDC